MAEDAEKMKFIEKNKISLERLILLNKVSVGRNPSSVKEKGTGRTDTTIRKGGSKP